MTKREGYQPSNKSEIENKACQNAFRKLNSVERNFLAHSFRRFYRLQNFGETSLIELVGKLGMHLSEKFPPKLDPYANNLQIGDHKNKIKRTTKYK